jgi:hypothetical protein
MSTSNRTESYVLRLLSMSRHQPALWRVLQGRPEMALYELIHAPLGWPSLFVVIHLPGRALVFAQPLRRDWGTSITNGAEAIVHAAYDKFGLTRYYEWYVDEDSLDEILLEPVSGRVSWRYFTRPRFESSYAVRLPRLFSMAVVQAAERDYTTRYV